jgi:hypothetical protein
MPDSRIFFPESFCGGSLITRQHVLTAWGSSLWCNTWLKQIRKLFPDHFSSQRRLTFAATARYSKKIN